jgi:hypothetical protein
MAVPETEMVEVRREGLADLRVTRADLGTVQAAVQAVDLGNRDSASPLNHREATKLHASPQGFS